MPSFLNNGTAMTAAARNTTASCANDMLIEGYLGGQRGGTIIQPEQKVTEGLFLRQSHLD
jgi:hypothetical protein